MSQAGEFGQATKRTLLGAVKRIRSEQQQLVRNAMRSKLKAMQEGEIVALALGSFRNSIRSNRCWLHHPQPHNQQLSQLNKRTTGILVIHTTILRPPILFVRTDENSAQKARMILNRCSAQLGIL